MLFRQASVDVCPPPPPSQPVRFDGSAYPPPKGWKIAQWVLRRPTGQQEQINARKSRRKKEVPRAESEPKVEPKPAEPSKPGPYYVDWEAEYAKARAGVASTANDPFAEQTGAKPELPPLTGQWTTPDQWVRSCKKGRKAALKSQGRNPIGVSQRRTPIPTGRTPISKKQAEAKKGKDKKSPSAVEVTDTLLLETAEFALSRFKTNRVSDSRIALIRNVLVSLLDLVSPEDGFGEKGLLANMIRRMREAIVRGTAEDKVICKRLLHAAATKALGELIKRGWDMIGSAENVTEESWARHRVGANRSRTIPSANELQIRFHRTENGREVFFLLKIEKSGRKTLQGIVCSKR